MSTGLIALLDDVVGLAKVAAASLDDAATQATRAGAKAAGVVIDDAAVTPRYLVGFAASRELPIVARIAAGSLKNKLLYLLPAALVLSILAPGAITPLLMLGGAYLCYEGAEKVYEAVWPHSAHHHEAAVGLGDLREEHISRQGFFGPVAMIYREHGPNEIVRVEGTLHPRRIADTTRIEPSDQSDPRGMPEVMLSNADVSVAISRRTAAMPCAYRNTEGDLLYFVHQGTGRFVTEFGRLSYEPGDYILIPKGITFQLVPDPGDSHMLVVESPAPLSLAEHRQVGRHMPVDPTVLVLPELHDEAWPQREEWELRVKHGGTHSSIFYRHNPLASVGWKGDLFPFKLNIRDIIPISSDRIHIAPSAWCTFEAIGFVVITFVPQIAVADLNAEELPSYHRNIDNDESVFVHHGEAGSRKPGTLSHTPQGILHGANEATRAAFQARRVPGMRRTLCGVSVDTDRPLIMSPTYERLTQ